MKQRLSFILALALTSGAAFCADTPAPTPPSAAPAPTPAPALSPEAVALKEKMQGTWTVVAANRGGNEMPEEAKKMMTVIIKEDAIIIKTANREEVANIIQLDVSKTPAWIDLQPDKKEDKSLGLVKLDGDTLEICFSKREPVVRPAAVAGGKGIAYLKLARQK